ncbi:MAG: hypothetical protein HYX56_00930 [Chloroflexi bacterium]|nr:hypothetical protein [Chloroflexota bacterium]
MRITDARIAAALALAGAIVYLGFGWGTETTYDYYGRLASAFVSGRWWLVEAPPWLNELIPCGSGRWCVAYPPLPAVLAIPFLPLGTAAAQVIVARIAGGASTGFVYLGLRRYGAPLWVAVAGAAVSAIGTTLLFSSADGRAWYAAHSVAMLFTSAAFWLAARGGPAWAIGAALGLGALARLPIAAAFPALALLAARRGALPYPRALTGVVLGGLPFAAIYVAYNVLRWGSVLDLGYAKLTEDDIFFSRGLFSLSYLPRHIYAIFLEPPDLVEGVPWFLRPRFVGMSLFVTTPALLWVFAGLQHVRRDVAAAAAAIAAGLALLPDVLHGTTGFQQFGYRFSIDAQPYLIALAVGGDAMAGAVWRRRPSILFIVAAVIAAAVNVYAAIAIIRFGWWQ